MEAILLSSTPDQSISPYKNHRSPRKNAHAFISRPSENFSPSSYILNVHGGLIGPPPSLSSSLPFSSAVFNQPPRHSPLPPPPLLPLPISSSKRYSSLPTRSTSKGLANTSPPTNRKTNSKSRGGGGLDVTSKKQKSSTSSTKQGDSSRNEYGKSDTLVSSDDRLGPDPRDLPKKVPGVMNKSRVSFNVDDDDGGRRVVVEELSCSIFSLAPPPSSLPLPKFSLKPKLSCNVDAGATDNLRRLLRLR